MIVKQALIAVLGLLLACAASQSLSDSHETEAQLAALTAKQNQGLESFASLLRVKVWRQGRIDDFRVELFSQADSAISLYVRGFLGKAVLKATLINDSLTVFFPSKNLSFVGKRSDLEVGKLQKAGHVIDFLLTLFRGAISSPDSTDWELHTTRKHGRLQLSLTDKHYRCNVTTRLKTDRKHFPYLKLESLDLVSADKEFRLHLQTQSSKFNRRIPSGKFDLKPLATATLLTKEELANLLLDLS